MTDDQIKHMVDRFLGWRLPENFSPDAGISFERTYNEHTPYPMKHEPIGTNLFDAQQAEQMVRYMVEGMPCRPNPETQAAPSSGQDMVLVPRETLEKALVRLEHIANKIPENVPMTFHEEDCYYLATEIKTLLAEGAAPVASQMGEPVAWRAWAKAIPGRKWPADQWVYWDEEEPTTIQDDPEFEKFQALYAAPAAGMDADSAADEIGKLFQSRWGRRFEEPVMPQEIAAIIRKYRD